MGFLRIFSLASIALWFGAVQSFAQGIVVPDDEGNYLALIKPAQRIISLAPHITENLFAVGLGERVIGADEYSNYPPAAKAIPRIGRAGALDVERIVALKPDVVIAWGSGNTGGQVEQLRRLGVPVFVSEVRTLTDVPATLRRFAQLGGTSADGEREAAAIESGIAQLGQRYAAAKPVSVFYQIWHEPLMTVNREHSIAAVLRLCGGKNIFDSLPTLAPTVSKEAVLRADPEVIIGSGSDDTRPQWLNDWRHWPQLRAVRTNALVDIPPDLMQRPTPRFLEGARRVCAALDQVRATK